MASASRSTEEQAPWRFHPSAMTFQKNKAEHPPDARLCVAESHLFSINLHRILAFDFSQSQDQTQGVYSKVTCAATEIKISQTKTCLPCSLNSEQQSSL